MRLQPKALTSAILATLSISASAGSLTPPAGPELPASAMYGLSDLYHRLHSGAAGQLRSGPFVGPTAGPAATGFSLNQIMAVAPTLDNTNGATAAQVLQGRRFWGLRGDGWGAISGTMVNQAARSFTPSAQEQTIPAGFYDGSGKVLGDGDLTAGNIRKDVTVFGVTGTLSPPAGNATADQVLFGRSFSNATSTNLVGNMPNRGAITITPSTQNQAIPNGFHNGSGIVVGDGDLVPGNISSGVSIFGVPGNLIGASGTATPGQVLAGVSFSNSSGAATGSMPNRGQLNHTPTTTSYSVLAGYYSGGTILGDTALISDNIRSGTQIFGIPGSVIPATGEAQAAEVLSGVSFSNSGGPATGSMPNRGPLNHTPTTAPYSVLAGYYSGGTIDGDPDLLPENILEGVTIFNVIGTASSGIDTSDATAAPTDLRIGQTAYVNGESISGTRYPAPTQQTQATQCFDTNGTLISCSGSGQDGEVRAGVEWPVPRFIDNEDGTVLDQLTGLTWLQDAGCSGDVDWYGALQFASWLAAGECGLSDGSVAGVWRLPNVRELASLIDFRFADPGLSNAMGNGQWSAGNPFSGPLNNYSVWSSTTAASDATRARVVRFRSDGLIGFQAKSDSGGLLAWPVKGGGWESDFMVSGEGMVSGV